MKILLIGPQGSGKSTQAEMLAQFLHIPKINTGDIFRKLSTEESEEAQRVKTILSEGRLVDDETTAAIVQKRLTEADCQNGFILDGYPRNINQVNIFDPNFDKVIYLNIPDEKVIKRLMGRGREDDTPELIETRLDLYHQQTKPLLDYYQNKGQLIEINGLGSLEGIQDEIRKHL